MAEREQEIYEQGAALTPAEQDRVLDYIRAVRGEPVQGEKPGHDLLRFAGIWSDEEAEEISRAIEDGCERVDPNGWRADAHSW